MGKGHFLYKLQSMSPEDRHAFDRWLKANAVVGSIFAAALIAMALLGSNSVGPGDATVATSMKGSDIPSTVMVSE
jgi:hypothetical protein